MSDQGDTGQWRPATSQSGQYSTPDETTGPLPAVPADEDDAPVFPPVSSWSPADEDDVPTGGFPAVEPPAEPLSQASQEQGSQAQDFQAQRSPFEPADDSFSYGSAYAPADELWRSFGSAAKDAAEDPAKDEPAAPEEPESTPRFGTQVPETPSYDPLGSSFGSGSFDDKSFGAGSAEDKPFESSSAEDKRFGSNVRDEEPFKSWADSFDDEPQQPAFGGAAQSSYGLDTYGPGTQPPRENGVTAEEQAAENEFFASDDHPPMWDKVVAPAGPPPKPGKPSSGNLRLPDWMRDEGNGGAPPAPEPHHHDQDDGRSRRPLYLGVSVLVAGLIAAAGVYFIKGNGDAHSASGTSVPTQATRTPAQSAPPSGNQPARNRALPRFKGVHTKAAGRINDQRSGLSYPKLVQPWAPAEKKSPMTEIGFSASQFAVTEKAGGQPKYWGRLMSAQLGGVAKDAYTGPGGERDAVNQVAQMYEERMYGFKHTKKLIASQPLDLDGHKGWLVGYNVRYHRPGLKATTDVVAVALVDTGKKAPGVLFMSVPNTDRKLWPDVNFVMRSLKVG
jgi:hypothetical protein